MWWYVLPKRKYGKKNSGLRFRVSPNKGVQREEVLDGVEGVERGEERRGEGGLSFSRQSGSALCGDRG